MEILFGIILYLLVGALIIAVGQIVVECDDSMSKKNENEIKDKNRRRNPLRNLLRDFQQ